MNTKYLMMASAVVMCIAGIATSFFPQEILNSTGLSSANGTVILLQITGALYFGFAMMNWMAKTVLIGGIYSKPLAMGNFMHFVIGALALLKITFSSQALMYVSIATIVYTVFAILFGIVTFTSPAKKG